MGRCLVMRSGLEGAQRLGMRVPSTALVPRLTIGLAMGVALAGCSGSSTPPAGHVATPSTSSSSASPSPSDLDAEVEAAVRAYYAELTRAAHTFDTSMLQSMTSPTCTCLGVVGAIKRIHKAHHRVPGIKWLVDAVAVHDVADNSARADVRYRVPAYVAFGKNDRLVKRFSAQHDHVDLLLVRTGSDWQIDDIQSGGQK